MNIFTVYSKDNCPFCDKAKALLAAKYEQVNIINIPTDMSKDDLEEMVRPHIGDADLTVPQIFIEGEIGSRSYIGGFDQLDAWYVSQETNSELDDMAL
ncbi:MAG: glutaredoxin family protein [Neptunomonas phycophila]|uniref:glutaredoxin domain-containing protein n=1 Tax=Neptunomonas phycophila TaxID=1572645 RepID=UPI003B8C8BCE